MYRMRYISRHGANVNTIATGVIDPASTLLHTAAAFAHPSLVNLLLKAGAAVNALTQVVHAGTIPPATPLDMAVEYGHRTTVPIILRAGGALHRYRNGIQPGHPDFPHHVLERSSLALEYLAKVDAAGGFKKYEQAHLATLTKTFTPKFPMLPPEMVRHILTFGFHAGYY